MTTATSSASSSPSREIGARLRRGCFKITVRITRKGGNVNDEKSDSLIMVTLRQIQIWLVYDNKISTLI